MEHFFNGASQLPERINFQVGGEIQNLDRCQCDGSHQAPFLQTINTAQVSQGDAVIIKSGFIYTSRVCY